MNRHQQKVVRYYKNPGSRIGYSIFTWDTKHFGYYPSKKPDITEKKAQTLTMDLLAQKLELKANDLVLDAGCGRGTTSCYLAEKYNANVIGIDIVDFELEMAKNHAKKLNLNKKVEFLLRDYSDTKFPNNYFDKVFTLETIVHSPNLEKTLKEFNRILKPKAKLVLFEYSRSDLKDFNVHEKKMLDIINNGSAMTSFKDMMHDSFAKHIENAGFKVISEEDITEYMGPSLERLNKYAKNAYRIIKLLGLQKHFINTTAAVEFYGMAKKGLIKYRIFVAEK